MWPGDLSGIPAPTGVAREIQLKRNDHEHRPNDKIPAKSLTKYSVNSVLAAVVDYTSVHVELDRADRVVLLEALSCSGNGQPKYLVFCGARRLSLDASAQARYRLVRLSSFSFAPYTFSPVCRTRSHGPSERVHVEPPRDARRWRSDALSIGGPMAAGGPEQARDEMEANVDVDGEESRSAAERTATGDGGCRREGARRVRRMRRGGRAIWSDEAPSRLSPPLPSPSRVFDDTLPIPLSSRIFRRSCVILPLVCSPPLLVIHLTASLSCLLLPTLLLSPAVFPSPSTSQRRFTTIAPVFRLHSVVCAPPPLLCIVPSYPLRLHFPLLPSAASTANVTRSLSLHSTLRGSRCVARASRILKADWAARRARFWQRLPGLFGLPPWAELERRPAEEVEC
ncbi:hypothetical protein GGX14DRAFT_558793 [Mycena pura]|uniref:Uncharacterized protein n=1 Tax=Mycena pura TaxID=153505 RepID=A0AAD6YKM2_9AGAR|nr:hypothetical protein GGX14DRAFT_558793 [Mycena pura]